MTEYEFNKNMEALAELIEEDNLQKLEEMVAYYDAVEKGWDYE